MSDEKDDGGPAFPQETNWHIIEDQKLIIGPHVGLSMRGYFAAAALTGFASQSFSMFGDTTPAYGPGVSKFAYEIADAMLEARKAKP